MPDPTKALAMQAGTITACRVFAASWATCRPWKRAMASSLAVGVRSPFAPAMVDQVPIALR